MERWILVAAVGFLTTTGLACSKSNGPDAGEVKRGEHLTDATHLSSGYEENAGHESAGKRPRQPTERQKPPTKSSISSSRLQSRAINRSCRSY